MSLLKEALKRQLDNSGILLLKAASVLSDEEFFSQPTNGASMAWTLGHLTALQDWALHRVFLKDEPLFTREKREALKGGRHIMDSDKVHFSDRHETEANFSKTQTDLIHALHDFNENDWNQSTPSGCRFPTYGTLWEHLAVHNFWHLGELSATTPRISHLTLLAPRFYSTDHAEMN
jgi:hypothetical protein